MKPESNVNFKVQIDAKHEGGHYVKIKFDWLTVTPPAVDTSAPIIETQTNDTGFMKDWNLIQIEGEEPVE